MREIYFDNAATTRVRHEVTELICRTMEEDYGNPSSKHGLGMKAEMMVKESAEEIAATLKVKPSEIVFTSGATESNNTAIIGAALARQRRGKHIISTAIEHASVYRPLDYLSGLGYEISILGADSQGHADPDELKKMLRKDTILVSIMTVNNEIGSIQPIAELGKVIRENTDSCWFHTDAVQGYGKLELRPARDGVDLLSMSAHKIHGPKGAGFLYVRSGLNLPPYIRGGGQQKDRRSGTENVPGTAGTGLAAKLYYQERPAIIERVQEVSRRLRKRLEAMEGVTVNTPAEGSVPHILSASFEGIRAEVLLHALEEKGIYVSSGSACSSNHPAISGTLKAIGVRPELLDSTLRFSFGMFSEPEEAELCADAIEELLPVLRRFRRC